MVIVKGETIRNIRRLIKKVSEKFFEESIEILGGCLGRENYRELVGCLWVDVLSLAIVTTVCVNEGLIMSQNVKNCLIYYTRRCHTLWAPTSSSCGGLVAFFLHKLENQHVVFYFIKFYLYI